jgi:hypothetical protein
MGLTWRDGLAAAFVGAAVLIYMLSLGNTTVAGLSGPHAVAVAIFALGIGGCYTARSQMQDLYGAAGVPRRPLLYVVLASVLGGVTLVAGVVAIFGGGPSALATLTGAMVVLCVLATIRHSMSRKVPGVIHPAR